MTKEQFLKDLAALLDRYCCNNSEYENIHSAYNIKLPIKDNLKREVRVSINTYYLAKEE